MNELLPVIREAIDLAKIHAADDKKVAEPILKEVILRASRSSQEGPNQVRYEYSCELC